MFSDNGWRMRRRLRRHSQTPNHSTSNPMTNKIAEPPGLAFSSPRAGE